MDSRTWRGTPKPPESTAVCSRMSASKKPRFMSTRCAPPTSTPERLKLVAKFSSGFIYLVSRTGVTGERAELSEALQPLIDSTRAISALPVAAGFGISTPGQAGAVAKIADGVVVGSAIVRLIEQNAGEAGLEKYARSLRNGMDA